MEDPSNPIPSLNSSSVSSFNGIEKCCHVPGRSVNRRSTTWTPASFALRIASRGVAPGAGFPPCGVVVGSNVAVMGRSSRGSGGSRMCTVDATTQACSHAGLGRRTGTATTAQVSCGRHAGRYRPSCAVSTISCRSCNILPSLGDGSASAALAVRQNVQKMHTFRHAVLRGESLEEVPKLDSRKFTEPLLNLALRPLQEDPARRAMALTGREVQPPAYGTRAHIGIGLEFHEHVPALVAPLQLAHVLRAILTREGSAHAEGGPGAGDQWVGAGTIRTRLTLIEYAPETNPAS